MMQRYYFDTSVFGGVFDAEFEEETLQLFEKVKMGQLTCVYSDLTERELVEAPQRYKIILRNLLPQRRNELK